MNACLMAMVGTEPRSTYSSRGSVNVVLAMAAVLEAALVSVC